MALRLRISGTEPVGVPEKEGLVAMRWRGSHCMLRHPDGRRTVVPVHRGETIGPGLLAKILRDTSLTREDLERLINR